MRAPSVAWRVRGWGVRPVGGARRTALGLLLVVLRHFGSVPVRLYGWPSTPTDMAVGVSVGYMSVGWACGRARGRGALGERPNGEGVEWEERGEEWADMESGEGVGWGGERIRWGSGILGLIEHADRRA